MTRPPATHNSTWMPTMTPIHLCTEVKALEILTTGPLIG